MSCGSQPPLGLKRRFLGGALIDRIEAVSTGTIGCESVVEVETARVVCANYDAIVRDFPHIFGPDAQYPEKSVDCVTCTPAKRPCPSAINAWLVRNAGVVSRQQAEPNTVNSSISHVQSERVAYRPPGYGRALVVPVDSPAVPGTAGFLDLKGAGVAPGRTPSQSLYSNGLEYLGYAIADFFYGWLIDSIFARTFPDYGTVPVYAVIDLGFDIVDGWHGTGAAGLHVRRAHTRPVDTPWLPSSGSDRERLMLHIELLLRTFGLTTAGPGTAFDISDDPDDPKLQYNGKSIRLRTELEIEKAKRLETVIRESGGQRLEMANVQLTNETCWENKSARMYDFGQVNARRDFVHPMANPVLNAALQVGRILSPADASFVRPNRAIAVDPYLCDRHSVNAYGFFCAQAFRSMGERFGQHEVETLLRLARLRAFGKSPRF